MFEISDVMIDKQEVAMSLNIKISVSDEEAFTDEYPINFSVSKNICSVSDFEISTILEKVLKILSLQGFACISCAQIECILLPLSDCKDSSIILPANETISVEGETITVSEADFTIWGGVYLEGQEYTIPSMKVTEITTKSRLNAMLYFL